MCSVLTKCMTVQTQKAESFTERQTQSPQYCFWIKVRPSLMLFPKVSQPLLALAKTEV